MTLASTTRLLLSVTVALAVGRSTLAAASEPTPLPIESVRFTEGFGVVRIGIGGGGARDLVSSDDGRTFRRLAEPGGRTGTLLVLPNGLGYRTDPRNRLWRTGDRGRRWHLVALPSVISAVEAVSTGVWALQSRESGDGPVRLVLSQDGGRTWSSQPTPVGYGPDGPDGRLSFADAADGVLTGLTASGRPLLRVTRDGGRTWMRRRAPCSPTWTPHKGAAVVRWLPSGAMWFLCVGGAASRSQPLELHQSFDGGRTFTLRSRTALSSTLYGRSTREIGRGLGRGGGYVAGLDPLDADHAHLTTGSGVMSTVDGGQSWKPARHPSLRFEQLFDFDIDGRTQWFGRRDGGLLRSDDGGAHWRRVPLPTH